MAAYRFSLHEDRIAPGGWLEIATAGANRLLYCVEGSCAVGGGSRDEPAPLARDEASLASGLARIETGHTGALLLRWELAPADAAEEIEAAGAASGLLIERTIEAPEADEKLMRLDAVALAAGGEDATHILPGPSLRVLASGAVSVAFGDRTTPHRPGGAWFATEGEAVAVRAEDTAPALLLRATLLPVTLAGENALFYAARGDADGPPAIRVYVDQAIAL
jgi:hypothetical protein